MEKFKNLHHRIQIAFGISFFGVILLLMGQVIFAILAFVLALAQVIKFFAEKVKATDQIKLQQEMERQQKNKTL